MCELNLSLDVENHKDRVLEELNEEEVTLWHVLQDLLDNFEEEGVVKIVRNELEHSHVAGGGGHDQFLKLGRNFLNALHL